MSELDVTKVPSARVVRFDALPANSRARLLQFLKGQGPTSPALFQAHTPAWAAVLILPVIVVLGALSSARLSGLRGYTAGLFWALVWLTALGWAAAIPLRFLWQRGLSTVPPGLYLFGAGVVEVRADGTFVLVPHTEVKAVRVVERSQSARGRIQRAYTVDFAVGGALVSADFWSEPTARTAAAKYYEQFGALEKALAANDWAAVSALDPIYELRAPELWNALKPERSDDGEPGERFRGSPKLLSHGWALGAICALFAIPWAAYTNQVTRDDDAYFHARSGSEREQIEALERYVAHGYARHRQDAQRELTALRARRAAASRGGSRAGALGDEDFARMLARVRDELARAPRVSQWAEGAFAGMRALPTRAVAFRVVRPDRAALAELDAQIASMVERQSPGSRPAVASNELTGGEARAVDEAGERLATRVLAHFQGAFRDGAAVLLREGPFAPGREPPVVVPTVEVRWSYEPRRCAFHRRSARAFCRLRTRASMRLMTPSGGAPVTFEGSSEAEPRSDADFAGTHDVGSVLRSDASSQLGQLAQQSDDWFAGR